MRYSWANRHPRVIFAAISAVLSAPLFIMGSWVVLDHLLGHDTVVSMSLGVGMLVGGSLIVVMGALILPAPR